MTPTQVQEFESTLECNFAMNRNHIGRFRVNAFRQRGEVGTLIRHIKTEIPNLEILDLPPILKELINRTRTPTLACTLLTNHCSNSSVKAKSTKTTHWPMPTLATIYHSKSASPQWQVVKTKA
jgi:hypothetical protein